MFTSPQPPVTITPENLLVWMDEGFRGIETAFKSLGKRQPYASAWISAGTQPGLGDGTLIAAFVEIGSFIVVSIELTTGASTTYGSGNYSFKLPRAPANVAPEWIGSVEFFDTSAALRFPGMVRAVGGVANAAPFAVSGNGMTVTVPFTWAPGDKMTLTAGYPVQ
jgi:hypothetical protein